jgi:hypothetical protein
VPEVADAGDLGLEPEGDGSTAPIDGGGIGLEVAEGLASLVQESAAARVASRLGPHALLADSPPDQPLQPLGNGLGRLSDDQLSLRPSPTDEPVEMTPPTRTRLRRGPIALVAALGLACAAAAVMLWPSSPEGEEAVLPAASQQTPDQSSSVKAESPRPTAPSPADSAHDEARSGDGADQLAQAEIPAPPASPEPAFVGAKRNAVELTEGSIPAGLSADAVSERVRSVLTRAERCHLGGRTTGTAYVHLTFRSKGRVRKARIEGEPVASAAVAKCLLVHARAVIIPEFEGAEFTVRAKVTLL